MASSRSLQVLTLVLVTFGQNFFVLTQNVEVRISTNKVLNTVSDKFLSFTIDPSFLLAGNNILSPDCSCMASSLSPAYIRVAGPTTSRMTFENSTITFKDLNLNNNETESSHASDDDKSFDESQGLVMSLQKWKMFVEWAKQAKFSLVFALSNMERNNAGLWDPNNALRILTFAENENIGPAIWQLGYECDNQTIDQYFDDLKTLDVIINTFSSGLSGGWKLSSSDVTKCLADDSENLRNFLYLSSDFTEFATVNGDKISNQLSTLKKSEECMIRTKLEDSNTQLWLNQAETVGEPLGADQVSRAIEWLNSLGRAARDGFSVHFKELIGEEFSEPTMSYYMTLLHKKLVGKRVLNLQINDNLKNDKNVSLFAHCTSLKGKNIPGAITIFGSNSNDDLAKVVVKFSGKEDGGDIMQYILNMGKDGTLQVNGKPMIYEGDIRPSVKRVRPYKGLVFTLPAKSFGFWVVANAKIKICESENYDDIETEIEAPETEKFGDLLNSIRQLRMKRDLQENEFIDIQSETFSDPKGNEIDTPFIEKGVVKREDPSNGDIDIFYILAKLAKDKQLSQQIAQIHEILLDAQKILDDPDSISNYKKKIDMYLESIGNLLRKNQGKRKKRQAIPSLMEQLNAIKLKSSIFAAEIPQLNALKSEPLKSSILKHDPLKFSSRLPKLKEEIEDKIEKTQLRIESKGLPKLNLPNIPLKLETPTLPSDLFKNNNFDEIRQKIDARREEIKERIKLHSSAFKTLNKRHSNDFPKQTDKREVLKDYLNQFTEEQVNCLNKNVQSDVGSNLDTKFHRSKRDSHNLDSKKSYTESKKFGKDIMENQVKPNEKKEMNTKITKKYTVFKNPLNIAIDPQSEKTKKENYQDSAFNKNNEEVKIKTVNTNGYSEIFENMVEELESFAKTIHKKILSIFETIRPSQR